MTLKSVFWFFCSVSIFRILQFSLACWLMGAEFEAWFAAFPIQLSFTTLVAVLVLALRLEVVLSAFAF